MDKLVDRDCLLLDGNCVCLLPFEDCKYLKEKNNDIITNGDDATEGTDGKSG